VEVRPGGPEQPDAWLRTDPGTLNVLLHDPGQLDRAVADGAAVAGGDRGALRRLLETAARGPATVGSQG
jgi:hypothetical protein